MENTTKLEADLFFPVSGVAHDPLCGPGGFVCGACRAAEATYQDVEATDAAKPSEVR
jgi:hypothetical protein